MLKHIAITLAAILALTAAMVAAQTPPPEGCMAAREYDTTIKELDGETPAFAATLRSGAGLVIYVNDAAKTFTMAVFPRGHPEWRCPLGPLGLYGIDWRWIEPGEGT